MLCCLENECVVVSEEKLPLHIDTNYFLEISFGSLVERVLELYVKWRERTRSGLGRDTM